MLYSGGSWLASEAAAGGGILEEDGGRCMLWVCCMEVLSGRGCSPHRLERDMAESSGCTSGVNSTAWPS